MKQVCFFVYIVLLSFSLFSQNSNLLFAIGEWEPYTGTNLEKGGMITELVRAACDAEAIASEYVFSPWKRSEIRVQSLEYFGTFPYSILPERLDLYFFSDTIYTTSYKIVKLKNNPIQINTMGDFKNYRVGIIAGTDSVKQPLEKTGAIVLEFQSPDVYLKRLQMKNIDFVVDDISVIMYAIKKSPNLTGSQKIVFLSKSFNEKKELKIMASKEYPDVKDILLHINKGLKTIKENGVYLKILEQYGLSDFDYNATGHSLQ